MTNDSLVINEVLCYILHSYSKIPLNQLKAVVCKWFKDEELTAAKEILMQDVEKISSKSLPRYPKRKGENKQKLTVDDIFEVVTICDESVLLSSLPKYVIHDISKVPQFKPEDIDIFVLNSKLQAVESKIAKIASGLPVASAVQLGFDSLEAKLLSLDARITMEFSKQASLVNEAVPSIVIGNKLNDIDCKLSALGVSSGANTLHSTSTTIKSSNNTSQKLNAGVQSVDSVRVILDNGGNSSSLCRDRAMGTVTAVESVVNVVNSVQDLGSHSSENRAWADIVRSKSLTDDGQFTQVNRRRSNLGQSSSVLSSNAATGSVSVTKRKRHVVGCNLSSTSDRVRSGVKIVKKCVFHVDNLHTECSVDDVKKFVSDCNIQLLSCFEAKSWLRESERDNVSAFRICVAAEDKDLICDADIWPEGVMLRDWVFRQTHNGRKS
jgi:hypothetical protein